MTTPENHQPKNKRQAQWEETRTKLLAVSLRLFTRRGFSHTTIRDIASSSEVSTGLFFHYFASKDAVLAELVGSAVTGVDSVVARLKEDGRPAEIFEGITQMVLDGMKSEHFRALYLLVNQVNSLESFPSTIKDLIDPNEPIRTSVAVIRRGQKLGEFGPGKPLSLATVYWCAIQGLAETATWNRDVALPESSLLMRLLLHPHDPRR